MRERCPGRAQKVFFEPVRDRLGYLAPQCRGMGEMGVERVRQPDLAVAQLREVAIGEHGPGQIASKPVIDVGA